MGYTVRSLSERLAESGVVISPSGITKIELGQRRVSVGEAMAIARCLEVNLGVMMSGDPIRVVVTA
jgi:transcriptional regulator with XRE-family HTH domain